MRLMSWVPAILPLLTLVSACALFPPSLIEQGVVTVDIEKTQPVYVSHATVYREAGETVVSGEARFPIWVRYGMFRGHIDVDVASPNGDVLKQHEIKVVRRRIPKVAGRRAGFSTRFSVPPVQGTIVHIAYHEGKHENRQAQ